MALENAIKFHPHPKLCPQISIHNWLCWHLVSQFLWDLIVSQSSKNSPIFSNVHLQYSPWPCLRSKCLKYKCPPGQISSCRLCQEWLFHKTFKFSQSILTFLSIDSTFSPLDKQCNVQLLKFDVPCRKRESFVRWKQNLFYFWQGPLNSFSYSPRPCIDQAWIVHTGNPLFNQSQVKMEIWLRYILR